MKSKSTARSSARRRRAGFTLVEVLVALLIMALLAGLAWQGLDGIARASDGGKAAIDRAVRLDTVLTQWEQDLDALFDTEVVPAIAFDGQTLRLTRRVDDGVAVVAWSVRDGRWQRWATPGVTRVADLQQNWLLSQQLLGNEPGQVTLSTGASGWLIYFNRGGQWSNAQSTGDLAPVVAAPAPDAVVPEPTAEGSDAAASAPAPAPAPAAVREVLPDGVRMVITLDGQTLTRDIALGPAGS
jgi:general secretion pathway protein J